MTADRRPDPWTDAEVRALVDEARSEARAEVKARLREAFARALAGRVEALATGEPQATRPAEVTGQEDAPARPAGALWYVYGIVAAADHPPVEDLEPVPGGGAVTAIEHGRLAAVASPVPGRRYAPEPLTRGLNDRAWLERVARAHERVLGSLLPRAVVPFRLCSVFSAPERVVELLDERAGTLTRALGRVDGRTELGVKVLVEPAALRRAAVDAVGPEPAAAGEGSAYLANRARRRQLDDRARELAGKVAAAVHARLAAFAVDAVRGRPQPRELTGEDRWMALNGSYLVERSTADAFAAEVGRLGTRFRPAGVELTLTGPWAPYSFTRLGEVAGTEGAG
jgi:hypothetical protein